MWRIILTLLILLLSPRPVFAQAPVSTPTPFPAPVYQPYDFNKNVTRTLGLTPTSLLVPTGRSFVTFFKMIDTSIFMYIITVSVALFCVAWLISFIFNKPAPVPKFVQGIQNFQQERQNYQAKVAEYETAINDAQDKFQNGQISSAEYNQRVEPARQKLESWRQKNENQARRKIRNFLR